MKFIVSSSLFYANLQIIGKVVVDKNSITILDSYLFLLSGNVLSIVGSDGDIVLETDIEVTEGIRDGKFAVNAKTLIGIMKDIADQPITFTVDPTTLQSELAFSNGDYQFMAQLGDEYPEIKKEIEMPHNVKMSSDEMSVGINHTLFAAANDEMRPVMNGVFFDFGEDMLSFVASDTHKLMCYSFSEIKSKNPTSFILPRKPASMLKTILAKESGDVLISFDAKSASFKFSAFRMTCLLIEGKFPNYRAVIPMDNHIKVVVDRGQFLSALRRINSVSEQAGESSVEIEVVGGKINLKAEDINCSFKGQESLITEQNSDSINIAFRAAFLIDALSNMSCYHVVIELKDATRSGVIRPMDSYDGVELLALIVPMVLRHN